MSVRQCFYSVPARYAGRRLPRAADGARPSRSSTAPAWSPATNGRSARYVEVLVLDHYLEVLKIKPGALPGATALAQAKAARRVHRLAPGATGTRPAAPAATPAGTRALIEVLLAHRSLPAAALIAAMDRAVAVGMPRPAGRAHRSPPRKPAPRSPPVVPIGALARYDRPAPTLTGYDDLLTGSA